MTPQQLLEFEQLKREVRDIKAVTDVAFVAELRRRLSGLQITLESGASLSGTTVAVRNAADSGSETVANDYTGAANLYLNGVLLGKIGYY